MSDVVTIRLEHGKANTLDPEHCEKVLSQLHAAERSGAAVILTAGGPIFSAGVDLFRLTDEGEPYLRRFLPVVCDFFLRLFSFPGPMIVAINGHAIAGGCVMALACDYRLMADAGGRIGLTELLVGVPFPAVVAEIVRYSVPRQHFQEVMYFARTYEAPEALEKGLIDEPLPAEMLEARASEVARQFAAVPADAFRLTKMRMRTPAIAQMRSKGLVDQETTAAWVKALGDRRIRAYIEKATGKQ